MLCNQQSIFSNLGNSSDYKEVRAHPLSKLASLINQLNGLTIVTNLNMVAQLLAVAMRKRLKSINKMPADEMRRRLYGRLDEVMRFVIFSLKYRFLKFEKVEGL